MRNSSLVSKLEKNIYMSWAKKALKAVRKFLDESRGVYHTEIKTGHTPREISNYAEVKKIRTYLC